MRKLIVAAAFLGAFAVAGANAQTPADASKSAAEPTCARRHEGHDGIG
jgi:hypothetical protein